MNPKLFFHQKTVIMNSMLKNAALFTVLSFLFSVTVAFTPDNITSPNKTIITMADNSCTLYVKKSTGSPARSVKVSTEVSGGISCVGGRSFYTDSDGEVTLKWVSGCKLRKIYVDGRGYDVDYTNGNSYSITMR